MAIYGYARVSTTDQDLTIQQEALKTAGCEIIRTEKISGTSRQGRDQLALLMEFMRQGDTLVVTRVDRLARSIRDLQNIVHELKERGISIKATEQPIDTSTAAGKFFLDMLGVFSEFETTLRKERQAEGIAKAKARGAYVGGKRIINHDEVRKLKSSSMGASAVAKKLNISRASVYRILKEKELNISRASA
jgi:DNA invertase Pin-like site-specific DNA recombinase